MSCFKYFQSCVSKINHLPWMKSLKLGCCHLGRERFLRILFLMKLCFGQCTLSLQSTESFGLEAFFFFPVKNWLHVGIISGFCVKAGGWNHLKPCSFIHLAFDAGCQLGPWLGLLIRTPTHGFCVARAFSQYDIWVSRVSVPRKSQAEAVSLFLTCLWNQTVSLLTRFIH